MRLKRARRNGVCGNALIEFACALPILLTGLLLVVQMTVLGITKCLALYATYMAARAASVHPASARAAIATRQAREILMTAVEPRWDSNHFHLRYLYRPLVRTGAFHPFMIGEEVVPFIAFSRTADAPDPNEDNPLP